MAQFAQPSADVLTTGWGTAPLWSKIDEGSAGGGDATTIAETVTNSWFVVDLGAVTDPNVSTGHVLRMRWGKLGLSGPATAGTLELRQGYVSEASLGTLIATFTGASGEGAYKDESYTLTGTEADSITDYSDLQLRAVHRGGTVDYLEFEVPDAGGPIVVAIGVATESETAHEVFPPFPVDIPVGAVIGYWDARQLVGSPADPVSSWAEFLGIQDPFAQATSGFRPVISDSGFGGLRSLEFDGTDDYLTVVLDQTYSDDFAIVTVLEILTFPALSLEAGVVYSTGAIPNKNILGIDDATGRNGWTIMSTGGGQEDHYTATNDYANMGDTPSRFVMTQLVRNAGELRLWENGVMIHDLDLSAETPLNDMGAMWLATREDISRPAHIRIAAKLLVDMTVATQTELLTANDDLGTQFAVPGYTGGTPQTIAVGAAVEAEVVRIVTPVKPIVEGVVVATEAEVVEGVVVDKEIVSAVSSATESEAAQGVTATKPITGAVGAASEAESAQEIEALKPIIEPVTGASEAEAAQVVTPQQAASAEIGTASESETAQEIDPVKEIIESVDSASETETAGTVSPEKVIIEPVAVATESEVAQLIDPVKAILEAVTAAQESEAAQAVDGIKPIVVVVGAASEEETAYLITVGQDAPKFVDIGVASESEVAGAVAAVKPIIVTVGAVSETELAQAIGTVQPQLIEIVAAAESEGAFPIEPHKYAQIAEVAEGETAGPIMASKPIVVVVSAVSESEASQAVEIVGEDRVPVGGATESEAAQAVAAVKPISIPVSPAEETELAREVGAGTTVIVGAASESEAAQALAVSRSIAVGVAQELEAGATVTVVMGGQIVSVTAATESEMATEIAKPKWIAVGGSAEGESAQPVTAVKPLFIEVGSAAESESVGDVAFIRVVTMGAATETEQALTVDIYKVTGIGAATETEVAQTLGGILSGQYPAVLDSVLVPPIRTSGAGLAETDPGSGAVVVSHAGRLYAVKKI